MDKKYMMQLTEDIIKYSNGNVIEGLRLVVALNKSLSYINNNTNIP